MALGLAGLLAAPAGAAEDQGTALRRAARSDVPLSERLAAVRGVLEEPAVEAPEPALRAAASLLDEAPDVACWLLKATLDAHRPDADARRPVVTAIETRVTGERGAALAPLTRARLAAAGTLVGLRPEGAATWIAAAWAEGGAADPFLRAVVEPAIGIEGPDPVTVAERLTADRPAASALDRAASDDLARARGGLDALLALGPAAVPVLRAEVRRSVDAFVPGRRERATRAILVLGILGDRSVTSDLIDALGQGEDGWVRAYAAVALGDLGDPAAVVALARQVTLLGDPLRDRDQWEFPGATNTTVPESAWDGVEYYAIDTQAADALLRLGVRGALGWLIHRQLDPRQKNFRIRVLQDARDAVRRAAPDAPIERYNVDQGLPQRDAAFRALADWWHAHRDDRKLLAEELDPADARFHAAALGLADVLSGEQGVREMMMANAAIDLLGPLMTRALVETVGRARAPFHRAELAQALGRVRDPAALGALLELVRERTPFVRAKAAIGLGPYARTHEGVRRVLLQLIRSKNAAVRTAALQALVNAPRDPAVREALARWREADDARVAGGAESWRTPDVERALAVIRFVQEGAAAWGPVEAGLAHVQRVERRTWWDLLRAALDVAEYRHDPVADPEASWARRFTKADALAALGALGGREEDAR